ncbi:alpha/beta hydrolase [Leptospira stimsonii]|uniref:Alpha/beta hydrolase n=1 Tax=Leptospira stimsonii TaxID=2202203 RepID=A0A4R9L676_9LEPT|nr:alpha/beta hydrolase [Leptospira stimsonii]RHX88531.1 hypothetical protein DLM78_06225 [Leptospira stimsonii]TGK22976.1 alpha/beta hydrolase [Leptospira stimsonii]TGM16591.1 alpha/beta hydrolase [Leptospira stimsonii]
MKRIVSFSVLILLLAIGYLIWNPMPVIKLVLKHTNVMNLIRKDSPLPTKEVRERHSVESIGVDGANGFWLDKKNSSNGVLIYLHGGAYIKGPFATQWKYVSNIIQKTSMAAIVVDYGMPPKFPFPKGLDGTVRLIEILQNQNLLSGRWFLLGDSAGGGLAVAVAYQLRDLHKTLPNGLILMSPWLDLSMENPDSLLTAKDDPMLAKDFLIQSAKEYAPDQDLKNPLLSPIYGNTKGLPPILLQIGTAEIFLADNRKFYENCKQNGVQIQYEEYPEAFHVFMMLNVLKEARKAIRSQVDFLQK